MPQYFLETKNLGKYKVVFAYLWIFLPDYTKYVQVYLFIFWFFLF